MTNKTSSILMIRETQRENSTFVEKECVQLNGERERQEENIYMKSLGFSIGPLAIGPSQLKIHI